jgi:hypothetical protein
MDKQTLEQMIASDIFGLLDIKTYKTRWGILCGPVGAEMLTMKHRYTNIYEGFKCIQELIRDGFRGCLFREIKKDGEWTMVATEDF